MVRAAVPLLREAEGLVQDPGWRYPVGAWRELGGQGPVADPGRNVPAEVKGDVGGRVQRRDRARVSRRVSERDLNPRSYELRVLSTLTCRETNNRRSGSCICVRGGTAPNSPWLLTTEFPLVSGDEQWTRSIG
jgi:hypothetical protein